MDFEVKNESEIAASPEVQQKNGLLYVMPQTLSSSVNKTFIRQQAQRSSYSPGQTMVFDLNTGSRYIDPENCALMFDLVLDGTAVTANTTYSTFSSNAGAIAVINEIRIHAKSGVELDRIQECNQYAFTKSQLKENADYHAKYASLWGGGPISVDKDSRDERGQIGATVKKFLIPMKLISGLFNPSVKGMKMPPGLLSGARIEIVLEQFGRAIGPPKGAPTAPTTYTITDPMIICMSHELSDSSQSTLNEVSVENGLEYTFNRVFTTVEPSASGSINIQVKKAVSQGLRAFDIPIDSAKYNALAEQSFSGALAYTNYQFRIGSNFYPQQKVDSDVEGYYTTQNIYDKHSTAGWYSNGLSATEYVDAQRAMGAGFETDSRLLLSGTPINNSSTLTLEATVTAGTEHRHYVFLEYVAVARSYLTNVELKI